MKVLIPTVSEFKEKHELPKDFPHTAPEGYEYRVIRKNATVDAIWTVSHLGFVYNDGNAVHCIWGFYNRKTGTYYAPINSTKQGDLVDIKSTTPYSAMQLNLNPLERAFL